MKKVFILLTTFIISLTACDSPNNKENPKPSLTIRNQSSYDLTDVKFSDIVFSASGSNNELPISKSQTREFTANDIDKTSGYIYFTRKDIGIACRTTALWTITADTPDFIFQDSTAVIEVANPDNTGKTLSTITFLSRIGVEYNKLSVPKKDTVSLGQTIINQNKQNEFTLKNTGVGKLLLSGSEPIKIDDATDVFTVVQPTASEIAPNNSLTFKINFNPKEIGDYTAQVTISSNDKDGDFTFTITAKGMPSKPIASIFYDDTEISQNGTINAGDVIISNSKNINIVVKNSGSEILTLDTTNITITGTDANTFNKLTNLGGTISVGSQSSFIIECKPTKQGENNAILTIPTNDESRNPVIIYLRVTGGKGTAVLELSQSTTIIKNDSITAIDFFGQVELGTSKSLQFNIKNSGNISLGLTGEPLLVESSNPLFIISTQPANKIIKPGESIPFVIRYTPTAEKADTSEIIIMNDSDDMVFSFIVKGTCYEKKGQINIKQGTSTILPHEEYNFGDVVVGKTKDIIFTISNSGDSNLNFIAVSGNQINLTDNNEGLFTVTNQPTVSTVVTPGNSTTFTIRFSPVTLNSNFTATVMIKTDSRDNNEFSFRIKGASRSANSEARLSGLQFTIGKLDKQFNSNIYDYTLKIDASLTLVNLIPTSSNSNVADIKVNGTSQRSGVKSQDIILATTNTLTIVVMAEDETTTLTYTVTIDKIVNYSSINLSSFYVSNMEETDTENIVSELVSNNDIYWETLPDETQLKFKITPVNSNATVKLNDNTITNGVYTAGVNLNSGSAITTFTFTITSEDGENTRTIIVKSEYLGSQWTKVGNFPTTGSNALNWTPEGHTVIVHNNQFIMTNSGEVFTSSNGTTWTRSYDFYSNRQVSHYLCSTVLFNNTIYNIGGVREIGPDNWTLSPPLVSYSTNGGIWTTPSVTGLTNGIQDHTSVVFNGAIYTMGGSTATSLETNAVWKSTDGITWSGQITPSWSARSGHASVVYNNKIFVMGGCYNNGDSEARDVWSTTNGTSWTQETSLAEWTGRNSHTVNVNSKGMWLVAGNDGLCKKDVWFSRDGKTWHKVLDNAPFEERAYHAAAIKDGYLYIFGGRNYDFDQYGNETFGYSLYDIWKTYIGD